MWCSGDSHGVRITVTAKLEISWWGRGSFSNSNDDISNYPSITELTEGSVSRSPPHNITFAGRVDTL